MCPIRTAHPGANLTGIVGHCPYSSCSHISPFSPLLQFRFLTISYTIHVHPWESFHLYASTVQKREREFEDYIREKYVQAKTNFRELLKENKLIDHTARRKLAENPDYMREIVSLLEVSQHVSS